MQEAPTSMQKAPTDKQRVTTSMQAGTELGTRHGQEEHTPTRTPSSPPPSRARTDKQKKDRMSQRRKEQRRQQMSSSRNLSPEDAGATAIILNPETTLKPNKPATGQELSPSLHSMPRDPPKQPTRRVGTYVHNYHHHQTSTLLPQKKANTEQTQPLDRKSAEEEQQQRNVENLSHLEPTFLA